MEMAKILEIILSKVVLVDGFIRRMYLENIESTYL